MGSILDPKFRLSEAPHSDLEECFRVMTTAFSSDELWTILFKDCDPEEVNQVFLATLGVRWVMDDTTIYKITHVESGYVYLHCC